MAAFVFQIIENSYESRNETKFKSKNIRNFRYGIETVPLLLQEFGAAFLRIIKNVIL